MAYDRGIYRPSQGETGWYDEIDNNFARIADLGVNPMSEEFAGSLADAITAAGTDGTVVIPAGATVNITAVTSTLAGLTIRGLGPGATLVCTGASTHLDLSGAGVTLEGLTIDASGATATNAVLATGNDFSMDRCKVIGAGSDANAYGTVRCEGDRVDILDTVFDGGRPNLRFDAATEILVRGCRFYNYISALWLNTANRFTIQGNQFLTTNGTTINNGFDSVLVTSATDGTISGNTILTAREHGVYVAGGSSSDITITGNTFKDTDNGSAVKIGATSPNSHDRITVTGNTAQYPTNTSSAATAYLVSGPSSDITISGNAATGPAEGIHIGQGTGIIVTGNAISVAKNRSIAIHDDSGDITNCIVSANIIRSTTGGPGIHVRPIAGNAITNLFIDGNIVVGSATTGINLVAVSGGGSATNVRLGPNVYADNTTAHRGLGASYTNPIYDIETSGTATIASGNTSIAVTHSLGTTPTANQILVTPIENWGSLNEFWVDTITSTQFTIRCDTSPGENVGFAWRAMLA